MEMVPTPRGGTPMSEVVEDFALDIVEEEAFKNWLDTRGVTPQSFIGKTDQEAYEDLASLCRMFDASGAREMAHLVSSLAPESGEPDA